MRKKTNCLCKVCGKFVDKSDASERFTTLTRVGVEGERYKTPMILCNSCTLDLDIYFSTKALEKLEKKEVA